MEKDSPAFRQLQGGNTEQGSNLAENPSKGKAQKHYIATPESLLNDPELSDRAFRVGVALVKCASRKGSIKVSKKYLAKQLGGKGLTYIQRGIAELKKRGYVVTTRAGRSNTYYLTPLLDVFQEQTFENFLEVTSKAKPQRLETKTSKPETQSRFAHTDYADLHTPQIQIDLIQNKQEQSEGIKEPSPLIEARFDDEVKENQDLETSPSVGFKAWLDDVSKRSSRLVGSHLNLNSSSPKLKNSLKALKAFYDLGGTPSEVAELVSHFLKNYPAEVKNPAALVASNFEAILSQTPKVEKALEGSLCPDCRGFKDPSIELCPACIDHRNQALEEALEAPLQALNSEAEVKALEAMKQAREAIERTRELAKFRPLVLAARPETSEEELEALFTELPRVTRDRLNLFSREQLSNFLTERLEELNLTTSESVKL